MKKILTSITAVALLASLSSLTACSNAEETPNSNNSKTVSQNSETNSDNASQNSENSDVNSDNPEINSEPETESRTERIPFDLRTGDEGFAEKLALFNMENFTLPNGGVMKNEDADLVHGYGDSAQYIGFDSLYLYKTKPYFRNTADEPDMINWETLEVKDEPEEFTDLEYFKVTAGDVLDNGLKVKSAEMLYGRLMTDDIYIDISFDGELTLEGILYRTPEDEYMSNKGDLRFFPDTTKADFIVPYRIYDGKPALFADNVNKLAVYYSSDIIRFGNETEAPSYVSDMFEDNGVFVKAKVTFTDLQFKSTAGGVIPAAVIKSIVKL